MSDHTSSGVGAETAVYCPEANSEFGPKPSAQDTFNYCPYCGESTDSKNHRVDTEISEVFCEETGMSTYRFCPNCGERTD